MVFTATVFLGTISLILNHPQACISTPSYLMDIITGNLMREIKKDMMISTTVDGFHSNMMCHI